jgi:riboflavin kinase/FMN adenylyltransferase
MQTHFGIDLLEAEWPRAVACIGTFDGVHLGHAQVISSAVSSARDRGLPAVVITFDRHPAAVLAPDRCPLAVASIRSNLERFAELGVAASLVLPFDRALADTRAEDFLLTVVRNAVKADLLVVGHDFAFGHDRVGTADWLKDRIETVVIPPYEVDGVRVSSSSVRRAIAAGQMREAHTWLGRPFAIEGVVVHGAAMGRKLGYPTANLARSFRQVTPGDGVYVGTARCSEGSYRAAISVGLRPTIDATTRTIEAYLLDYKGDSLYGQSIALDFERRLRDQVKFDSLESLKEQMAKDVAEARG